MTTPLAHAAIATFRGDTGFDRWASNARRFWSVAPSGPVRRAGINNWDTDTNGFDRMGPYGVKDGKQTRLFLDCLGVLRNA